MHFARPTGVRSRRILVIFTLTTLCWATTATAGSRKEARSAAKKARKAEKAGDYEAALEHYEAAFEAGYSPKYLVKAAEVEITLSRYIPAYKRLEQALAHPKTKRRLRRRIRKRLDKLEPQYRGALQQKQAADRARQQAEQEAARREREAKSRAEDKKRKSMLDDARSALEKQQQEESKRRQREQAEEMSARLRAERDWKGTAGWSSLVVGALICGGGGWWLRGFQVGQSELNKDVGDENAAGRFEGLDYATYKSRQEALNQQATLAVTGLAVGGTAVLTGALFLLTRPNAPDVTLAPTEGGMMAVVRGTLP